MAKLTQTQVVTGAVLASAVGLFAFAEEKDDRTSSLARSGGLVLGIYGLSRVANVKPSTAFFGAGAAALALALLVKPQAVIGPLSDLPKHVRDVATAAWHIETDPAVLREFAEHLRAAGHVIAAQAFDMRARYHASAEAGA